MKQSKIEILKQELKKTVIGQESMIEGLIIGLLCDGHILIEGFQVFQKPQLSMPYPKHWV